MDLSDTADLKLLDAQDGGPLHAERRTEEGVARCGKKGERFVRGDGVEETVADIVARVGIHRICKHCVPRERKGNAHRR